MVRDSGLRRGWTTGACATAAAKSAYGALLTGTFQDPVTIALPRGQRAAFALAGHRLADGAATASVVKDAGDDPDVTHGALIEATVRASPGGLRFRAGPGVGTVTKPGLPVEPGEPAINLAPRRMIADAIAEVAAAHGDAGDVEVEIAIPGGEELARKTMNSRLGIVGGLSILGTTGIVVPYSCAAWIHSIYSGIDVARATGLDHVAGATGATSEAAVQRHYGLTESALIDMGDFVGGMLKYLRRHPVPRVTIAGGVAKMTKLAQGRLDLHSRKGAVDLAALADVAREVGAGDAVADAIVHANTAALAFRIAEGEGLALGDAIAAAARRQAAAVVAGARIEIDVLLFNRDARLVGKAPG
ncbi:MAG: cobalt-precorrin-5B (C(1))-methyltransferase [Defluviicoccus sp.]|nr:cobalt-precorrin-5B (C(1))-methyltransferase [Defluviicoccus sp.]MDE0382837.1 cobalt-precorrin-5B (C(1))-methyltransferase [Defluviicoccus sp.]